MITIYSKPSCVQCTATYRALMKRGIVYDVVDLSLPTSAAAVEYVTDDLGYRQAPVVVVDEQQHWSGSAPT